MNLPPDSSQPIPPWPPAPDAPSEPLNDDTDEALPTDDAGDELAEWKEAIRQDFEFWLDSLDAIPEPDASADPLDDAPDLYSFYEQFAAANTETRKANRRTAEAISQWGDTLARFEQSLAPLRETTAQLAAAQPKDGQMSRPHCLLLVELLDRMHRLARAFQSPPPARRSWLGGNDDGWRQAWKAQSQALDILVSHVEGWLKKEGVIRIDTAGQPFDPTRMVAVAAEPDATRPPHTVLEEVAAGYLRHGELLRTAQVKVSQKP